MWRVMTIACLMLLPLSAVAVVVHVAFDPGIFVGWNDLIVEGRILTHGPGEPRPAHCKNPRFLFAFHEGRVVVSHVIRDRLRRGVGPGDTISFAYRTGARSLGSSKDSLSAWISETPQVLTVAEGDSGLFGLGLACDGAYRPGWNFWLQGARADSVREFVRALEADSLGTVNALLSSLKKRGGAQVKLRF